jgi:hypothetical protein
VCVSTCEILGTFFVLLCTVKKIGMVGGKLMGKIYIYV